jgi:twinkle protein
MYRISLPTTAPGGNGEFYMICPICTPSRKSNHQNEKKMAVNMKKSPMPWRCNHCGEAGYVFTDEDIAHRKIKPLLNHPKSRPPEQRHYQWLAGRKIGVQTTDHFKINISNENIYQLRHDNPAVKGQWLNAVCLNFPYYEDGILINIKYRDKRKNFKLISGATKIFYNIDSIKNSNYCVITEGEFDAMAYHEAGITSVVSVPNGATISEKEKEYFEDTGQLKVFNPLNLEYLDLNIDKFDHLETIYLATDDDPTGIKLRMELARRLGKEKCKYIKFSDYKDLDDNPINDPNQLLIEKGKKALAETLEKAYDFPIENVSTAGDYLDEIMSDFKHGREKGKSTGYKGLDPHFSWMPSWVYMLNGYPNEGKTTFMLNLMVISTVLYGDKWGIYSPENYPIKNIVDTLAEILMNNTANIEWKGRMNDYDYKAVITEHIQNYFYFIDNDDGYTPKELLSVKEELIKKKGITGFFTDPWSALDHREMGTMREDQYIAQCLNREIRLAKKYNIINVISHHPPKPSEVKGPLKAPHPYQLSGGAMWWNKVHVIFCIHRINRTDYSDTKTGFHVQKVKEEKLFGEKTNPETPVVFEYLRRSNRFLERKNPSDPNSPYTVFPFKKWQTKNQLTFEDF